MDWPPTRFGDAAEPVVGVDCVRERDRLEHRQVVDRVAVRARRAEVETLAGGKRAYGGGFGWTVEDVPDESPGPRAVVDLRDRAQRSAEMQSSGDNLREFQWRAGHEPYRVTARHVPVGEPAGPFPDPSDEPLVIDLFAELDDFVDR